MYWNGSARWVEPGLEGFYTAALRPRRTCVRGLPTFDVRMADRRPYTFEAFTRAAYRGRDALLQSNLRLTVREYFSLFSALPTRAEYSQRAPEAFERVRAWEAANPELANRHPAPHILPPYQEAVRHWRWVTGAAPADARLIRTVMILRDAMRKRRGAFPSHGFVIIWMCSSYPANPRT